MDIVGGSWRCLRLAQKEVCSVVTLLPPPLPPLRTEQLEPLGRCALWLPTVAAGRRCTRKRASQPGRPRRPPPALGRGSGGVWGAVGVGGGGVIDAQFIYASAKPVLSARSAVNAPPRLGQPLASRHCQRLPLLAPGRSEGQTNERLLALRTSYVGRPPVASHDASGYLRCGGKDSDGARFRHRTPFAKKRGPD